MRVVDAERVAAARRFGGGVGNGGGGGGAQLADSAGELLPAQRRVASAIASSLLAAGFYIGVSAVMVVLNKLMPYTYGFVATNFLLLVQMLLTILIVNALHLAGLVHADGLTVESVRRVWPVTLFYVLNAAASLLAVRFLNLTAYSAIKRLTPLFILPVDVFVRGVRVRARLAAACAVIVLGTTLMARFDAKSPLLGYALGLCSCACQAAYLVFVKQRGVDGMSSVNMLYLHSFLSLPLLLLLVMATGELRAALAFPRWSDASFVALLLAWPVCGCLLNYALFLCTSVTSPMTTSIAGHIKGAALTLLGFFTFEGGTVTAPFLTGLALNLCGSYVYVHDKYASIRREARVAENGASEHHGGANGGGGGGETLKA